MKSKVSAQVEVEELLYGRQGEHLYGRPVLGPELGRCKAIKLTFNDPNTTQARSTFTCCSRNKGVRAWVASIEIVHTQVIFHARKKLQLQRLKELAAARTADQLLNLSAAKQLAAEGLIPAALVQDLTLACLDTWTQRLTEQKQMNCLLLI